MVTCHSAIAPLPFTHGKAPLVERRMVKNFYKFREWAGMVMQCGAIGCYFSTADPSGLCSRCLSDESADARIAREKYQQRFSIKFPASSNVMPPDPEAEAARAEAACRYSRRFARSRTGYGSLSPVSFDHYSRESPAVTITSESIFCRQCDGDGGATGNCPRCGGDGFEPNR